MVSKLFSVTYIKSFFPKIGAQVYSFKLLVYITNDLRPLLNIPRDDRCNNNIVGIDKLIIFLTLCDKTNSILLHFESEIYL